MVSEKEKAPAADDNASAMQPPAAPPACVFPKSGEETIRTKKGTYEVLSLLGKGAFGAVYKVRLAEESKDLAMKCESMKAKKQILRHECMVLNGLKAVSSPHFLYVEDRGSVPDRFLFVVLRLVGKNLWELRLEQPDKKFNMSTSVKAGEQCLAAIRDLHRCGYLHRDIKPPNFAIGREEDNSGHTVFILDFGLSRKYRTEDKDLRHQRDKAAFRGTTRYASLNALEGKEQSRKDDIESWWYMIVEFMIGNLPWKSCKGTDREMVKTYKLSLRKDSNLEKVLKNTPIDYMKAILLYLDTVKYEMIPDYDHVYEQLEAAKKAYRIAAKEPPEWDLINEYKGPAYEKGLDYNMKIK